jgi:peptide/nickel transport system permease protein
VIKLLRQRLAQLLLVILGLSSLVFFLVRISGDPATAIAGTEADPEQLRIIRDRLGLNDPVWVQYVRFLGDLLRLDFGDSYQYNTPAMGLVLERLPNSAMLAVIAIVLAVGLGVPAGMLAAVHRHGIVGRAITALAVLGQSVPNFVLGILLILVFSVWMGWLPSFGQNGAESVVMPVLTLWLFIFARQTRLVQAYTLDELNRGYVRTATSLGYTTARIRFRHVLRNVTVPLLSLVGLELGQFIAGSVIVESIFAWPGMGRLMVESVIARDYPVLQAGVFLVGVIVVCINFVVDLLYQVVDPRLRTRLVTT